MYLAGGAPDWSRIVVSGLSQGAGMAAYIAKTKICCPCRALFQSVGFYRSLEDTCAWLADPSATSQTVGSRSTTSEKTTAALLARAYVVLRIPPANIRVFDLNLAGGRGHGDNPFHGSTIRKPRLRAAVAFLFGQSP